MTPSIFTIERRKDFEASYSSFVSDLDTIVVTNYNSSIKFIDYLGHCIRFWPHRCGATGIADYLSAIGVEDQNADDRSRLLTLELIINLLYWAPEQNRRDQDPRWDIDYKKDELKNETERMLTNAAYILEQCCNMRVREEYDGSFSKYYICKRDEKVDAAVVAAPELGNLLLGYLDVRNEDDLEYKKSALIEIYKHMEPNRGEYKQWSGSVSEEFFACMNKFGIRHNAKSQVRLRSKKKVYDKLFMLGIYALQSKNVAEIKNEMKALRGD